MSSRPFPEDALSSHYDANQQSDLSDSDELRLSRRRLIKNGAVTALGASTLANALVSLAANNAQGSMQSRLMDSPYGPIGPVADEVTGLELLQLPEGFKYANFNDIQSVEDAITSKTAAVLLEALQGEGGVIPADQAFLSDLRKLCDERGILLLCDEVQAGVSAER